MIRFEIRIQIIAAYSIRDSIRTEISDSQVPSVKSLEAWEKKLLICCFRKVPLFTWAHLSLELASVFMFCLFIVILRVLVMFGMLSSTCITDIVFAHLMLPCTVFHSKYFIVI